MNIPVRPETVADRSAIREVNIQAFGRPMEADIVEKVRSSPCFIPDLSLVAERDGQIVGHVLFSEATIDNDGKPWTILALGPVAVRPEYQRQGIGGQMIQAGLEIAAQRGYGVVALIGHPTYYPRFGFVPGSRYNLTCSVPVPDDVFMVRLLREDGLDGIQGKMVFPPAFDE